MPNITHYKDSSSQWFAVVTSLMGCVIPVSTYGGTASSGSAIAWEINSGTNYHNSVDGFFAGVQPYNNDRQYIKLLQSFASQYDAMPAFQGQNKFLLDEKVKFSADAVLQMQPDKISLQVAPEGSIFYTAQKGDITVFLQYYLIDEFDDNDEAIVTIFEGDTKKFNFAGSLPAVFGQLSKELAKHSIELPELI